MRNKLIQNLITITFISLQVTITFAQGIKKESNYPIEIEIFETFPQLKSNFKKDEKITSTTIYQFPITSQQSIESYIKIENLYFLKIKQEIPNSLIETLNLLVITNQNTYTIPLQTLKNSENFKKKISKNSPLIFPQTVPVTPQSTSSKNTTGVIDGDLLQDENQKNQNTFSVFIIILIISVIILAVGVIALFLFSAKEEEIQLQMLNNRQRTRERNMGIVEVNVEHLDSRNWLTEEREEYVEYEEGYGNLENKEMFFQNGVMKEVSKEEFQNNIESKELINFEKEVFDPYYQPEFDFPGRKVGGISPYALPDFQKPHYFPYADGAGAIVTNNQIRGDKKMRLDLEKINEIHF